MSKPTYAAGLHDIPENEYHADPCPSPSLSSGILSKVLSEPLAKVRLAHPRLNPAYEPTDSTNFDLGSVAHALLLGKGAEIVAIDVPDWRTKAAQEARAVAIAEGKQPCLLSVYETAQGMVERCKEQLAADPDNATAFGDAHGLSEMAAIAEIATAYGPVWCRAMMDWHANIDGEIIIYDYKTLRAGADPEDFARYIYRENRDIQDVFYSLVLGTVLGVDPRRIQFRYVLQDTAEPHLISVVQLDDQAREFAAERMAWGINQWAAALTSGDFGGFPSRTHYIAAPNFALHQWAEKMNAGDLASRLDERDDYLAEVEG